MKNEIQSAVEFIGTFLRGLTGDQVMAFRDSLFQVLASHYQDHWFPEKPTRGSAYRCIRHNKTKMDPLLASALADAGLTESLLGKYFPSELTIWIDPNEVSYRFGEDGSIGVIYEERLQRDENQDSTCRMQDLYDTCRQQVHGMLQYTSYNVPSRPVGLDYLSSFVMV